MNKETRVLTVTFPMELYQKITDRAIIENRSKAKQIVHMIELGFKYREEADARALSLLKGSEPQ